MGEEPTMKVSVVPMVMEWLLTSTPSWQTNPGMDRSHPLVTGAIGLYEGEVAPEGGAALEGDEEGDDEGDALGDDEGDEEEGLPS